MANNYLIITSPGIRYSWFWVFTPLFPDLYVPVNEGYVEVATTCHPSTAIASSCTLLQCRQYANKLHDAVNITKCRRLVSANINVPHCANQAY